jgi:hypothetical protein
MNGGVVNVVSPRSPQRLDNRLVEPTDGFIYKVRHVF